MLVVGLAAGFGGGAVLRPVTITEVSTTTETTTSTQVSTIRETVVQTTSTTLTRTLISTQTLLRTSRQTQTFRVTDTITKTTTETAFTTVYLAERGTVLVTDRGSGNKDTRPFTLETPSDLKITIRITARADLRYVG